MRWRVCKRRSHEHRHPQARAGPAPQLARSSETSSVRHARRSRCWAERIAGLTLDPWQRDVLLSPLRAAPQCDATERQETVAALKAAWTVCRAASPSWSRRRCGSPASCSASSPAILSPPTPASGARPHRGRAGLGRVGGEPAGRSSGHAARPVAAPRGPAVLIVDEASRVRDELGRRSRRCSRCAGSAADPALDPGRRQRRVPRAWSSDEDWERVQITADQCPRISAAHLAAERIRLGDALYRQEYFGALCRRRAASSMPRYWHICSAITLRTGPTSRQPLCRNGSSIVSCNER